MINNTFTFKHFLPSNKFGFASNIFVLAKNKPVESTDREVGLPDATSTEVSSQNTKGPKTMCDLQCLGR
jgi:hypothetical protein